MNSSFMLELEHYERFYEVKHKTSWEYFFKKQFA